MFVVVYNVVLFVVVYNLLVLVHVADVQEVDG